MFIILLKMSREWIDIFQTYYKYESVSTPKNYINFPETCFTNISRFRHVDFKHQKHNELFLYEFNGELTDEEERINNLVYFLNLHGHKIKLRFIIIHNLSITVTRINEILSRTTSNLLYVSIVIQPDRYPVRKKFKFPLRMKLLYIDTLVSSNRCIRNIYSKLFIDADVEEYPCLIIDRPISSMLPEKYIDYTKITSLITECLHPDNNLNCCVNLRNLLRVDTHVCYSSGTCSKVGYNCFEPYTVFKKMECLMLQYIRSCDCDIKQIDHIPYYYFLTTRYYKSKRNRNDFKFRNRIRYEIECELTQHDISPYTSYGARISTTLRYNRFPHVLRLSKVLPKTIFYSILKLFLQSN